jgi:hypothetical protein
MKKLIFIVILILLFSCEKPACKTCVTTRYNSGASIGVEIARWVECDLSEYVEPHPPYNFPLIITTCK